MDITIFNEAKKLREKIDMIKTQRARVHHFIERGGCCGVRAVIEYTPGAYSGSVEALINDKEIIVKAAKDQLVIYDQEIEELEQQFERL